MNSANSILRMLEGKVESLTAKYDKLPLECDGLTRVLSYVLKENGIKHSVYDGSVRYKEEGIPWHFWIELNDGRVVDYRLRMWIRDRSAPHGVFKPNKYPDLHYENRKRINLKVTEQTFQILTMI
jgi:hypothetical protein